MPRRRTSLEAGEAALAAWLVGCPAGGLPAGGGVAAAGGPADTSNCAPVGNAAAARVTVTTAVRYTLEELAARHPGNAVEVRVPPIGAVQALTGPAHRRGTPPAVVETDAETWLLLATGRISWDDACQQGRVATSGARADLSAQLPLWPDLTT